MLLLQVQRLPWDVPQPEGAIIPAIASVLVSVVVIAVIACWEDRKYRVQRKAEPLDDELAILRPPPEVLVVEDDSATLTSVH